MVLPKRLLNGIFGCDVPPLLSPKRALTGLRSSPLACLGAAFEDGASTLTVRSGGASSPSSSPSSSAFRFFASCATRELQFNNKPLQGR
jgi:hypothetical protein